MGMLGEYLLRLTCCGILCSIVLSLLRDGGTKSILQLTAGVLLTVTAIAPFRNWEIPDLPEQTDRYLQAGYDLASSAEADALDARTKIIKEELEAYILDKANDMGCSIGVQVHMTQEGYPDSVSILGEVDAEAQRRLEKILKEDLGISKEQQTWNG